MTRLLAVVMLSAIVCLGGMQTAGAQAPGRVVVVWVGGTTFADWTIGGLPAFEEVLSRGSIGVASTRTGYDGAQPAGMSSSSRATILAGARTHIDRHTGAVVSSEGTPGALVDSLAAAGVATAGVGDRFLEPGALPDTGFAIVYAGTDGTFPGASGLRRQGQDAWTRASMAFLDGRVGQVLRSTGPDDVVIVVAATADILRERRHIRLAPIAVVGPGFEPGLLSSPTTRRQGVVSLIDIAPTVLEAFGVQSVAPMDGRPIVSHPRSDAISAVLRLDAELEHAGEVRNPLTRHSTLAAIAAIALAAGVILSGARPRVFAGTCLLAVAALPLAIFVEGALPTDGPVVAELAVFALAFIAAGVAHAFLGRDRAFITVLGATAVVPLVDVAVGSPLGHKSGIAFQIAFGGRFFGVDEAVLGIVVGAAVCAAALALDRWWGRRTILAAAIALAAAVVVLGSPQLGSKFGAPLTAVPAFGVLAIRAGGRAFTIRNAAALAALTLAITGLFLLSDVVRPAQTQTHLGRAASGSTDLVDLARRKLDATLDITFSTIWTPAALAFAGAMGLLAWRRRDVIDRGLWGRPHLRSALVGCVVGAVCAVAFNDGGVIAAAPILMFASSTMFAVLLGGRDA